MTRSWSSSCPSTGDGPVSSPWLEDEVSATATSLSTPPDELTPRWTVPGIVLDPPEAADLVLAFTTTDPTGQPSEQAGIVPAYDLRFAARSAELVLELITRGRVLPSLERTGDGWCARWRPLIDAHDRGRIEALVWALPLSFMAVGTAVHDADETTPDEVLRSYLWSVTDTLVRTFVSDRTSAYSPAARTKRGPTKRNAVAAWLAALSSPEGSVDAGNEELQTLCDALTAWHATVNTESEPVRTCFRIVPPVDEDDETDAGEVDTPARKGRTRQTARRKLADDWRIEFALQAVDDPSLLVSAETVWEDGPELAALERHAKHPDEHLLRGLGRAARLVPSIGSALTAAMPIEQTTDAAGALEFLRDSAPILEQAGFGVLAPPWWRSSRRRVGLRMKARTPSPSPTSNTAAIGLDALCNIEWEAVLGDDKIGLAELRQLARLKQPLVRIRGQWVELREGDIAAAIAAVGKKPNGRDSLSAGEVLRTALGIGPSSGDLPVAAVEADGWLGDLLAGAEDRRLQARPTPDGFAGELRPYQERGLGWLAFLGDLGLGACLADDMGLGKTAQLLALLLEQRALSTGPTLVLCPMSLVGNWQRETARFAPELSVYVHHGPDRLDGKAFTAQRPQGGPGAVDLRSRRARQGAARHRQVEPPRPRRGAADKEQRGPHDPERPGDPGGSPHRHDRNSGGEPPQRAVVDHAVPQPRSARFGEGVP